jgi:hypothetical protein
MEQDKVEEDREGKESVNRTKQTKRRWNKQK